MSIIFIDRNIPEFDKFKKYINVDIKDDLIFYPNISRIGFIWHSQNNIIPFGTSKYLNSKFLTEEFIHFLSNYKNELVIDLISCSLEYLYDDIETIKNIFPNIRINYSNSLVGNEPKGNWILESSGEDIKNIYFNNSISEYKYVFGLPGDGALGVNFSYLDVNNVRTFTLNNDFTIDNVNTWTQVDITYSDNVHQVIIDGNNKTITIEEDDFNGLFYAGNTFGGNNKPTIIKNLFIKATVNINVAIAKVEGYIKLENCHLELFGNINNHGGGLVYNNAGSSVLVINMIKCSTKMFGKIGQNAGPLIGYISYTSGNINTIDECLSVVSDSNSDPLINSNVITLGSSAGAFVGSGISNTVNITNSYCLFNGSMSEGSGIIAGKYLGNNGPLTINKFYAVSNITYAQDGSNAGQAANYSYNLSSYFGGSLPTAFTISNVNVLNLGINLTNIYGEIGAIYPTLNNFSKFTDYNTFAASANTAGAKIGTDSYTITFNPTYTFYSFTNYYKNNWRWTLDDDILKGISAFSSFTISNQTFSDIPFTPNLPTVTVGYGTVSYSSSDTTIATVDNTTGEITMLKPGTVTITATVTGGEYYLTNSISATFTISNNLPCLTFNTKVLTTDGYVLIQKLKNNDLILTHDNRIVPIISIFSTKVIGNYKTFPYIIPRNSIGRNYPTEDIKISGNHLIKYRNRWIRPCKNPNFKQDKRNKIIKYFHIELPNYETDHLVINNGTVVESLGPNIETSFKIYKDRIGL